MRVSEYLEATRFHYDHPYSLKTETSKGAVIVETRIVKGFRDVVLNHLSFLPKDYGFTIFHSNQNEKYVRECFEDVIGVNYKNIGQTDLDARGYNNLLTSKLFWDLIPYKKVLIFQADSLLLRNTIGQFECMDYVGAPWKHIQMIGGNGGLSYRSVEMMKKCIDHEKYNPAIHGNEDIYFCKLIKQLNGLIPDNTTAQQFSVETIFYPNPFGIHAFDKWLSLSDQSTILKNSYDAIGIQKTIQGGA